MTSNKGIAAIIVVFILAQALLLYIAFEPTSTGRATSNVNICVNQFASFPPIPDQAGFVGVPFTLQVNASDNNNDTLNFSDNTTLFDINQSGFINFTPTNASNESILITVVEQSQCGNVVHTQSFLLTISFFGVCGNNITETGEQCDDNNTIAGDGCSATCQLEFCGDGFLDPDGPDNAVNTTDDEQCDDGNNVSNDGCSNVCENEFCGDGIVQTGIGEQCDDNNNVSGDGCSATCQNEVTGGGGGGGACRSVWECGNWGLCVNGIQTRECEDTRQCRTPTNVPVMERSCFIPPAPTCTDGIRNQGEEQIDCGGPCPACETCSDGIQNQNEQGVDCGGVCPACPTCFDLIQNQGEVGVDCGGPCSACVTPVLQVPAAYVRGYCIGSVHNVCLTTVLLILVLAIMGIILIHAGRPKYAYWKRLGRK